MSSNAGILIHGQINITHTTHMNAQYAPNNIPTPWPLVLFSTIFSFIICCVGAVVAFRSIDPKYSPAPPRPPIFNRGIPLQPVKNGVSVGVQKSPTSSKSLWKFPTGKLIYYLTALFCTFRAVSAFMVALKSLHDNTTPLAAPSVILLALISTQIVHCNIGHNPFTRFILELDIIALATTFGICGYAPNGGEWWPRYSSLKIVDGNCPVYAGDCMSQAPHWISVGCGKWTTPTNYDSGVSYGYPYEFYLPYQNTGDLNVQTGMNTLHAVEMTIIVFGSIWWFFVILHLLDMSSTLEEVLTREPVTYTAGTGSGVVGQRSIFSSVRSLFPRIRMDGGKSRPRKVANAYQQSCYKVIITFGLLLGFLVLLMSIGGHASQMNKKLQTTYMDGFGPQVGTNFTYSPQGVIQSSDYWGNETSWSDCFIVRAPGSRSGFWSEWVEGNRNGSALFRIAAGL